MAGRYSARLKDVGPLNLPDAAVTARIQRKRCHQDLIAEHEVVDDRVGASRTAAPRSFANSGVPQREVVLPFAIGRSRCVPRQRGIELHESRVCFSPSRSAPKEKRKADCAGARSFPRMTPGVRRSADSSLAHSGSSRAKCRTAALLGRQDARTIRGCGTAPGEPVDVMATVPVDAAVGRDPFEGFGETLLLRLDRSLTELIDLRRPLRLHSGVAEENPREEQNAAAGENDARMPLHEGLHS